ncbi:MAG: glycosyltransferase family 2 protein [Mycobacteriaceae bacterium]
MDVSDNAGVWLIVPVFNEGPVIGDVVRGALKTFPNIVCVDDGSKDNSAASAAEAGAHVVRHPVNLGQGAAIQTGVEYARNQRGAQYFVTFDADGQHQVKDVVQMLSRLKTEPLDIIVGTRFAEGKSASVPPFKRLALQVIVALSPKTKKLGLSDSHNGLRVFNRTVGDNLNITMNGMSHASEFISLIVEHHWRVAEEPVDILYTEYSMSKGQSLINGVNIIFDGLLRGRLR